MEKLSKLQLPILVFYSSPFVLLSALGINTWLVSSGLSASPLRLILLSASFPLGLAIGRTIYLRRSHVEILFDNDAFYVFKGKRDKSHGQWKNYKMVSIILDQFGRADLRLYKSPGGEHTDLPLSKTNARLQEFRDYVQKRLLLAKAEVSSPQAVEAS